MVPKRKEPFTRAILVDILLSAPDGASLWGDRKLKWDSRFGRSLAGMLTLLAQTGIRKGEATVDEPEESCPPGCLSRSAVSWLLKGRVYTSAEVRSEFLSEAAKGDFVIITPCPSKCDRYNRVWGATPIWLPYQEGEALSAFAALARLVSQDHCSDMVSTALFTDDDGNPLIGWQMDKMLRSLLLRELPEETARLYSWHSARIYLATVLKASGAREGEIEALCRWQIRDSLKLYARMNREHSARLIEKAMAAEVTSAQAQSLSKAMPFLHRTKGVARGAQASNAEEEDSHSDCSTAAVEETSAEVDESGPPSAVARVEAPGVAAARAEARRRATPKAPRCETRPCGAESTSPKRASKKGSVARPRDHHRAKVSPSAKDIEEKEAERRREWVQRYGPVIYFPEDIETHTTFFERELQDRPRRRNQLAPT